MFLFFPNQNKVSAVCATPDNIFAPRDTTVAAMVVYCGRVSAYVSVSLTRETEKNRNTHMISRDLLTLPRIATSLHISPYLFSPVSNSSFGCKILAIISGLDYCQF